MNKTRLDPDRMVVYDVEPHIETRNRIPVMMLGKARIAGFVEWWDVALGKVNGDASTLAVMLTDHQGNLYWHRAVGLTGELEMYAGNGKLVDGQIYQLIEILRTCNVHQIHVETNGVGGFVPPILTKHARPHGIGVTERHQSSNKQVRILEAFEAPLSSRFLWCHQSVVESPAYEQLRKFDPSLTNQADDYIDGAAGAILETPIRLDRIMTAEVEQMQRVTRQHETAVAELDFD